MKRTFFLGFALFFSIGIFSDALYAGFKKQEHEKKPDWNKIADAICGRDIRHKNKRQDDFACIISFTFGKKTGRGSNQKKNLISLTVSLPDEDRRPAVYMTKESASEVRKVGAVFKEMEGKIIKVYDLKPIFSFCDICMWACKLPQVASYREEVGDSYVFAQTFKLNSTTFRGNATSVAAYDKHNLNLKWKSDFVDSGMESLSVFINGPFNFSSENIEDGFHLLDKRQDLWDLAMKLSDRYPQIRAVLNMPKVEMFETKPVEQR